MENIDEIPFHRRTCNPIPLVANPAHQPFVAIFCIHVMADVHRLCYEHRLKTLQFRCIKAVGPYDRHAQFQISIFALKLGFISVVQNAEEPARLKQAISIHSLLELKTSIKEQLLRI